MVSISLCMIVKNEEAVLGRCLSSVKGLFDEIIIVDTGSTDSTKQIAAKFTEKIYDFPWIDDFSAARNFAYEQAAMTHIMWLDADDILQPEEAAKLRRLKETLDPDVDAVMMRYHTGFDQQGRVVFSYYRERLTRRACGFRWQEPVHEYLAVSGKIINADISITHAKAQPRQGVKNLEIYEKLTASGQPLSPRATYYFARELKDHQRLAEAAVLFSRFLDEDRGWLEDNITACGELAKCYQALGDGAKALSSLFRSFTYDAPRAELCCQIGYHFKSLGKYQQAAFWFDLVLKLERPKNGWGFQQDDCWGYIPCLECAVCFDKLGEYEKAARYNELAALYHADSQAVAYNREYFAKRKKDAY